MQSKVLDHSAKKVLIIAAEASSALYAQRLLEYWQKEYQVPPKTFGIGSSEMSNLGFELLGHCDELAVMGITEVLTHYKKIKATYLSILERVKANPPTFALLMDYPGFNLALAKDLKKLGIPVFYYVSPQVWAWKKWRLKSIKKYVDKMLVILPFEEEFFKKHNVDVEFVGHPLLDEINPDFYLEEKQEAYRQRFAIKKNEKVLALMPGSRQGEIKHHLSTELEVAKKFLCDFPEGRVVILQAPTLKRKHITDQTGDFGFPYQIVCDDPFKMLQLADVVLCCSGTATLFVGLMEKPLVVFYKVSWTTFAIVKLFVRGIKYMALANIIWNEMKIPEMFQHKATPEALYREVKKYFIDEKYRLQKINELKELKALLGSRGATERVAKSLCSHL